MLDRSYQILGIPPNSDLAEIKRAYRNKAKQLHPDRNSSSDAHAQFLALSEAYDYLIAYKSGRVGRGGARKTGNTRSRQAAEARRRTESQARAQEHARMRYEAYKKTDHYKDSEALEEVANLITLLLAIFILFVLPVYAISNYGASGIVMCIVIAIVSSPVWIGVFRNPSTHFNFSKQKASWARVIHFEGFQITSSLLFNLIVFCFIGLSTLIPLWIQVAFMTALAALGYLYARISLQNDYRWFLTFGLGPFLFLSVLCINYFGSHSPEIETYRYVQKRMRDEDGHMVQSTLITLTDDAYEAYAGLRFFMEQDDLRGKSTVKYTFERGLLGLRVMTDYELSR